MQNLATLITDSEIKELDSKYCSYGDTVHYAEDPKVFRDCEGSFMIDSQDVPYLDLQMWYASCNLGYKNKRVADAVVDQINTMPQIASRFLYDYKVLLSEKIAKANEKRFGLKGRVHFNVGGAQANEDALKLVRNFTGKNLMFAFMGGYHGRTIGTSAITSSFRYREHFGHFGDRAHFVPFPYCYRCHYGKNCENCDFYCVKQFEKNFDSEYKSFYDPSTGKCEYVAFVAEPLQGTGGYIVPPKGYFKELKKVLDKYGILFVADEVQMGFYRTGKLWSIEHFGVEPDVITFGKSLTNGLNPLAGLWAKEEMINPDIWPAGRTHSTYSSNPIGTRAGYEVMSILEEGDFETSIPEKGAKFLEGLQYLKAKYPKIGNVDGLGLALRIECTEDDGYTPNKQLCDSVIDEGLKGDLNYNGQKCGIVLNNGGYYKNVITLVPAVTITNEEIEMAIDLLDQLFARF
ncbi:MAG: aminotransferase class III-fold pyridoxal phosphate-dependent enzyme [Candidatus Gastranaerophilales bacterium]|nr:aminotransferase class III-fold pyridoxal phosphate-dependent enzyme [Candidatus Gastranaerophilales bacterium]